MMTHGHTCGAASKGVSPTYRSWQIMLQKLTNPNTPGFARRKQAGINMDPRWTDFEVFLKDMGPRPKGGYLRRRDTNGGYSKDNCYWGDHPIPQPFTSDKAKLANKISRGLAPKKSSGKRPGRKKNMRSIHAQAIAAGLSPALVYARIRSGWSKWNALNVRPTRKGRRMAILLKDDDRKDGPGFYGGGPPAPGAQGGTKSRPDGEAPETGGSQETMVGGDAGFGSDPIERTAAAVILGDTIPPEWNLPVNKLKLVAHLSITTDFGFRTCLSLLEKFEWDLSAVIEDLKGEDAETRKDLDPESENPPGETPGALDEVSNAGAGGGSGGGVEQTARSGFDDPAVPGDSDPTKPNSVDTETKT